MSVLELRSFSEASNIRIEDRPNDSTAVLVNGSDARLRNLRVGGTFTTCYIDIQSDRCVASELLVSMSNDSDIGLRIAGDDCHVQARVGNGVLNTGVVISGSRNVVDLHVLGTGNTGSGSIVVSGNNNVVRGVLSEPDVHGVVVSGNGNQIGMQIIYLTPSPNNQLDCIHLTGTASGNHITNNLLTVDAVGNLCRSGVFLDTNTSCNWVVNNYIGDPADYGTDAIIDNGTDNEFFYPNSTTYGDNLTSCPPPS